MVRFCVGHLACATFMIEPKEDMTQCSGVWCLTDNYMPLLKG